MAVGTYLVAGARGLVGRAVVELLVDRGEEVITLGRSPLGFAADAQHDARHLTLDLLDRQACARQLSGLDNVSHVVYAALFEQPDLIAGWQDSAQIETNGAMLRNLLDFVEPGNHLTLLQGTKAYGAHLQPMRLPGKETDPRHPGGNFYWVQEDLVRERARGGSWSFTIMRPQIVCGQAVGSPMNVVAALGVYASIRKHMGQALDFPGGGGFVTEATDARLLAKAILWAGQTDACGGETLNITNGDVLEWRSIWPDIAGHFDMPVGEDTPQLLSRSMPQLAGVWDEIVATHRLERLSMAQLVGSSWQFLDAVMGYGGGARSTLLSTIKARQLGFAECIDTTTMFEDHFARLQQDGVLPG